MSAPKETKDTLKIKLNALGIPFKSTDKKADLEALLAKGPQVAGAENKQSPGNDGKASPYKNLTVQQLKEECKKRPELGVYSKLHKAELIDLLTGKLEPKTRKPPGKQPTPKPATPQPGSGAVPKTISTIILVPKKEGKPYYHHRVAQTHIRATFERMLKDILVALDDISEDDLTTELKDVESSDQSKYLYERILKDLGGDYHITATFSSAFESNSGSCVLEHRDDDFLWSNLPKEE